MTGTPIRFKNARYLRPHVGHGGQLRKNKLIPAEKYARKVEKWCEIFIV